MMRKPLVYLAGQSNEHDHNWKEKFKNMKEFEFHDWEFDSDQTSPDTFYLDDLRGVYKADWLVANPGIAPSEATWIEIGYFLAINTKSPGETCNKLIIVWRDDRNPKWSIEFVKKAGFVVRSVEEAIRKLRQISKRKRVNST